MLKAVREKKAPAASKATSRGTPAAAKRGLRTAPAGTLAKRPRLRAAA